MHSSSGIVKFRGATKFLSDNTYNTKFIKHVYTTYQYNNKIEN